VVSVGLFSKLRDNGVVRVNLHSFLGDHVSGHRAVSEGLGLHNFFHVSGPAVFARDEDTGGVDDALRDNDFLDLVSKDILNDFAEVLVGGLGVLGLLLLVFVIAIEVEAFFGDADQFLAIVFFELLDHVFVDGVSQEEDFEVSLAEAFGER